MVRLVGIEGCTLKVIGLDCLNGTPLLDIKPYVPPFDAREADRIGWLTGKTDQISETKADGRFV